MKNIIDRSLKNAKEIGTILLGNYVANLIAPQFDYKYAGPIELMFQGYNLLVVDAYIALFITPFIAAIFWLIFKITSRKRSIEFLKILGLAFFAQLLAMAIFALGNGLGGGLGLIFLPTTSAIVMNLLAWRRMFPAEAGGVDTSSLL